MIINLNALSLKITSRHVNVPKVTYKVYYTMYTNINLNLYIYRGDSLFSDFSKNWKIDTHIVYIGWAFTYKIR